MSNLKRLCLKRKSKKSSFSHLDYIYKSTFRLVESNYIIGIDGELYISWELITCGLLTQDERDLLHVIYKKFFDVDFTVNRLVSATSWKMREVGMALKTLLTARLIEVV